MSVQSIGWRRAGRCMYVYELHACNIMSNIAYMRASLGTRLPYPKGEGGSLVQLHTESHYGLQLGKDSIKGDQALKEVL